MVYELQSNVNICLAGLETPLLCNLEFQYCVQKCDPGMSI